MIITEAYLPNFQKETIKASSFFIFRDTKSSNHFSGANTYATELQVYAVHKNVNLGPIYHKLNQKLSY